MSRLERKKRPIESLKLMDSGGMLDLFDNEIKSYYYLTDDKYDIIVESCSDEELELLITGDSSFSHLRKCLEIINKYI